MHKALPDSKLKLVQLMRFVAAFSVVICHNTFYTNERLNDSVSIYTQGSRGVALFFVISGFVMLFSTSRSSHPHYDWRRFTLRRLARIIPLYWFATTIKVIVILLAASLVLHAELDVVKIIKSYFFIPSENPAGKLTPFLGVGWTLVYEVFFYLVFALALYLRRDPFYFTSAIMIGLATASLFRTQSWPDLIYFLADPFVLDFVMGMIVAKIILTYRSLPPILMTILMVGGLTLLFQPFGLLNQILDHSPLGHQTNFVVGIISALVILGAVSLEDRFGSYVPNWILYLGAASYSLYLMHPMVGPIAPAALNKFVPIASSGELWFWASTLTGIAISVVVGSIVYSFFEKPTTNWLNTLINTYLKRAPQQPIPAE